MVHVHGAEVQSFFDGQWFFPDSPPLNPEHRFWLPEFLGDAIVVNGKTWPFLSVEPRRYRFLNGSNARFYSMRLVDPVTMLPGPPIWQIGTDGGLLDTPVMIGFPNELLIAPGERADVIIDFAAITPGTGPEFILYNSARAPFPKGAPVDPNTTGQIMKFVVGPGPVTDQSYDPTSGLPLRTGTYTIKRLTSGGALNVTPDVSRQLTLNEVMGPGGPLEVLLNNTKWDGTMSGLPAPGITEMPQVGSTEVWEIINLTADAHPIHLHLVQFQLFSRQRFQINKYLKAYAAAFGDAFVPAAGPPGDYNTPNADGAVGGNPAVGPYLRGKVMSPAPNETGWKDTVIMYPGEVTRIVVRLRRRISLSVVPFQEGTILPLTPALGRDMSALPHPRPRRQRDDASIQGRLEETAKREQCTGKGLHRKAAFSVTGSVNQKGEVQAIGGVNEKIEGFFEVCKVKAFTGEQGVIIPKSNATNLVLKEEVVEAIKEGKFNIWPVRIIDEGILTGIKAAQRGEDGTFDVGAVNYLADKRLRELAETMREFAGVERKDRGGKKRNGRLRPDCTITRAHDGIEVHSREGFVNSMATHALCYSAAHKHGNAQSGEQALKSTCGLAESYNHARSQPRR